MIREHQSGLCTALTLVTQSQPNPSLSNSSLHTHSSEPHRDQPGDELLLLIQHDPPGFLPEALPVELSRL